MADPLALDNDRTRAALMDADILGKLDYWRTLLHDRGLHTEALVMGRAAAEIRLLRTQVERLRKQRLSFVTVSIGFGFSAERDAMRSQGRP